MADKRRPKGGTLHLANGHSKQPATSAPSLSRQRVPIGVDVDMDTAPTTPPPTLSPTRLQSSLSPLDPISPWPPEEPIDPSSPSSSSTGGFGQHDLPGPKEVYGLIGVLLSYLGFGMYLVWALAPEGWLDKIGWTWYPAREWAVIVPCWLMVVVLLSYFGYAALSIYLTPGFDSPTIITDSYSNIPANEHGQERYYWKYAAKDHVPEAVDLPIDLVNRVLYPPRRRPS